MSSLRAYDATLQHCQLVIGKIAHLKGVLADSMAQLAISVDREYKAGRLDMAGLWEAYKEMRTLGPGFTKVWDQNISVTALQVRGWAQANPVPDGPGGHFWQGPYPYLPETKRPTRGISVVYVLYDADLKPIYLGSTNHFAARMRWHRRDGKPMAWWMAYPCESREAAYLLEVGLLGAQKPVLNVKVGR